MNFTGILGHILSTTGFILTFLILPHDTPPVTHQVQITPPVAASSYVATEHYTYEGHTVAVVLSIPKSGGNVSGTVSGDCTGNVTGTYQGGDAGRIQGTVQATCHVFLLSIPISGIYSGLVHTVDKKVDLHVDGKADGFEKSEDITLPLH